MSIRNPRKPVGAPRAKRQRWWDRQRAEVESMRANFTAPPGTFAWACLHGPDLCQRIRDTRPDLATWTVAEIRIAARERDAERER